MIYPDRELQELYIQNQSIWEEVSAGGMPLEDALFYMRVDPDSHIGRQIRRMTKANTNPLDTCPSNQQ